MTIVSLPHLASPVSRIVPSPLVGQVNNHAHFLVHGRRHYMLRMLRVLRMLRLLPRR